KTRPVMEGNTLLGMIGIPVHTAGLAHYLESEVYRTGRYFTVITDTLGNVAYSNRTEYVGRNIIELGMAANLAQLPQNQMFEYTSTVTGNRELVHMHVAPENGWMIISGIDRSSRMATTGQVVLGVLPFVLGLLAAGTVMFLFILQILNPLGVLANSLKDIASGDADLTKRLEEKGGGEIAAASRHFNQVMEQFSRIIVLIRQQTGELSDIGNSLASNMTETATAMNQITANIQGIKGRVLNQSASVTQTNATMEQVTNNINRLSGNVERQTDAVSKASTFLEQLMSNIQVVNTTLAKNVANVKQLQESAEEGKSSLQEVAEDIKEIARESAGLLEINAVMENIAGMTNLLSMNAAIEAARAGESGKGFAVVAGEIRKLAENSSNQSNTIAAVLKKIKDSIDKITRSTDRVMEKFESIDSGVKIVAEQEEYIRNTMEEQGQGSREVLAAAGQVGEITQQVKGGSVAMLEGSREVIHESKNLERVTLEITNGMNEMAVGAGQVNNAVNTVNELSSKNRENITALSRVVSQFKV
ncbi:MAG: methyl-accepting chemotaxis protein, partial [Treponema sp.]|nr:methyl-accepting chemotaxis protein [Treponema sp.]